MWRPGMIDQRDAPIESVITSYSIHYTKLYEVERWSEPVGNAMTGSFTASKDGAVTFHEFWAVVEGQHGLEIRLKHFHPNLASWDRITSYNVCYTKLLR